MKLTSKYDDALMLASELHRAQTRKGIPVPYLSHLMAVSGLVMEANDALNSPHIEDMAIAALLHDSIEDQGDQITLEQIEERFGSLVREIVEGCTDSVGEGSGGERPPWKQRKEAYLVSISKKSRETLVVSCADKTHNLRCIMNDHAKLGDALWSRFTAGKEGIAWYYEDLLQAFTEAWPDNPILPVFRREIERLRTMNEEEKS